MGMRNTRGVGKWAGLLIAAGVAVGCVVHTDKSHEWIRESASRDLSCPKGKLTVTHFTKNAKRKKAEGCGKQATYREVCNGSQCHWEREAP